MNKDKKLKSVDITHLTQTNIKNTSKIASLSDSHKLNNSSNTPNNSSSKLEDYKQFINKLDNVPSYIVKPSQNKNDNFEYLVKFEEKIIEYHHDRKIYSYDFIQDSLFIDKREQNHFKHKFFNIIKHAIDD